MPTGDPYLEYRDAAVAPHVRIDEAAAWRLLAQLHALRDRVGTLMATETALAAEAVVDWDGFTRRWFDDKRRELINSGSRCTAALDSAIASLQQAVERAGSLQRRWDGMFLQWRAEVEATPPGQPKPPPPVYPSR